MKMPAALVAGIIWMILPAHAAPLFPANQHLEVVSIDNRNITHDRTKLLFVRPAFLDSDFQFEVMDVHVATGCNTWGLAVKATRTGEFGLVFFRQTLMWCGEASEIEQRLTRALLATTRWRMDGEVLVLEGDASDVRLAPIAQDREHAK